MRGPDVSWLLGIVLGVWAMCTLYLVIALSSARWLARFYKAEYERWNEKYFRERYKALGLPYPEKEDR